jgi:hypothetical protein
MLAEEFGTILAVNQEIPMQTIKFGDISTSLDNCKG